MPKTVAIVSIDALLDPYMDEDEKKNKHQRSIEFIHEKVPEAEKEDPSLKNCYLLVFQLENKYMFQWMNALTIMEYCQVRELNADDYLKNNILPDATIRFCENLGIDTEGVKIKFN